MYHVKEVDTETIKTSPITGKTKPDFSHDRVRKTLF